MHNVSRTIKFGLIMSPKLYIRRHSWHCRWYTVARHTLTWRDYTKQHVTLITCFACGRRSGFERVEAKFDNQANCAQRPRAVACTCYVTYRRCSSRERDRHERHIRHSMKFSLPLHDCNYWLGHVAITVRHLNAISHIWYGLSLIKLCLHCEWLQNTVFKLNNTHTIQSTYKSNNLK